MKEQWKEKSPFMKAASVIGMIVSAGIIVLAVLQFTGVMEHADNIYMPGLSVLMFIQTVQNWKTDRKTAYFSLATGIFILALVICHFFF